MRLLETVLLISCIPSMVWACSDSCSNTCGDPEPSVSTPAANVSTPPTADDQTSSEPTLVGNSETSASAASGPAPGELSSTFDETKDDSAPTSPTATDSAEGSGAQTMEASTIAGEVSSNTPQGSDGSNATFDDTTSDSSSRLRAVPVGTTELALGFWEYLPPDYGDAPVPLLVFTHGASWQGAGTNETLQKVLEVGPPNLISTDLWPNSRPFLVLAPQNPHSGCFTSADIDALYTYALANYHIDAKRIYHTGQSCGAIGGWNYLAEHLDEHVTAAVLISGDGRDAFANAGCDLGKVAIWGLHNEKDGSVTSEGTISPLNDLMTCSPKPDVKLTVYPDETVHDAWTKTYDLSAGNDIYSWLLAHEHP